MIGPVFRPSAWIDPGRIHVAYVGRVALEKRSLQ
jgi:hypothetical protein